VASEAHRAAHALRSEDVIAARGTVARREPENVNPTLPTGEIELSVSELEILADAETPRSRANPTRQPEFTQLDVEMSVVEEDDMITFPKAASGAAADRGARARRSGTAARARPAADLATRDPLYPRRGWTGPRSNII
jgi:aspartyl-tRNA synthetase